ncbi:hypothetical protein ASD44_08365 [Mesorhizobium sp. Root554]|nr:hypothetical protein ASD27_08375 [Mesorhizobium sp. Root1471]KQZ36600.1 hypothetical protein ASD44_08365 [Mesorhizobium sp. Root554]
MIEMAPETAKRCKERTEGRCGSIGRGLRRGSSKPFRRPSDVFHLARDFVAKNLKAIWLPASSLRVSGQMAAHHFDQIDRS